MQKLTFSVLVVCLVLSAGNTLFSINNYTTTQATLSAQSTKLAHADPAKHSRLAWPGLSQEQVIALGEALKGKGIKGVILYCASVECSALRTDLDDAMQIADIDSAFEDRLVDSESDVGIFVGGSNAPAARELAQAIAKTTGILVHDTVIDGVELGLIIGKLK